MLSAYKLMVAIMTGAADIREDDVVIHTSRGDVNIPITKIYDEDYLSKIRVIG